VRCGASRLADRPRLATIWKGVAAGGERVFFKRGGRRVFLPAASSGDAAPEGSAAGEETCWTGSGSPSWRNDLLLRPRSNCLGMPLRGAGSAGEPQLVRVPDAAAGA
jgi:hypothetical protein